MADFRRMVIRSIVLIQIFALIEAFVVPSYLLSIQVPNERHPLFMGEGELAERRELKASEQELRQEEKRRKQRKDDVVIGKTSAKEGATDYALDPRTTQELYLKQASRIDQKVFQYTEEGLEHLKSLRLEKAELAFEKVFQLKPDAYLWQAGIVKFYLGKLQEAATLFARNAQTFESKFGSLATEERIWRDACQMCHWREELRVSNAIEAKKNDPSFSLSPCPKVDTGDPFMLETRKEIRLAQILFSSTLTSETSEILISRASLSTLGGAWEQKPRIDIKGWKLTSWFYLGLHYDSIGEFEESKRCMKMALHLSMSSGKSSDLVQTLPLLHMSVRDWFDDDDFDRDPLATKTTSSEKTVFSPEKPHPSVASKAYLDPMIEDSIRNSVSKLRLVELREALNRRDLPSTGSKGYLQEKLYYSLMDDSRLNSGLGP